MVLIWRSVSMCIYFHSYPGHPCPSSFPAWARASRRRRTSCWSSRACSPQTCREIWSPCSIHSSPWPWLQIPVQRESESETRQQESAAAATVVVWELCLPPARPPATATFASGSAVHSERSNVEGRWCLRSAGGRLMVNLLYLISSGYLAGTTQGSWGVVEGRLDKVKFRQRQQCRWSDVICGAPCLSRPYSCVLQRWSLRPWMSVVNELLGSPMGCCRTGGGSAPCEGVRTVDGGWAPRRQEQMVHIIIIIIIVIIRRVDICCWGSWSNKSAEAQQAKQFEVCVESWTWKFEFECCYQRLKYIKSLKTKSSVRKHSNTSNHSRQCPLLRACLFSICIAPYLFTLTDTVPVSGVKSDVHPVPRLNKLKINKGNEPAKLNAPKQHISVISLLQHVLFPGSDSRGLCHCPIAPPPSEWEVKLSPSKIKPSCIIYRGNIVKQRWRNCKLQNLSKLKLLRFYANIQNDTVEHNK